MRQFPAQLGHDRGPGQPAEGARDGWADLRKPGRDEQRNVCESPCWTDSRQLERLAGKDDLPPATVALALLEMSLNDERRPVGRGAGWAVAAHGVAVIGSCSGLTSITAAGATCAEGDRTPAERCRVTQDDREGGDRYSIPCPELWPPDFRNC